MHAQHIDFLDLLDGQVQYIVPRWQRRYRWGQADIERLVEDLLTVAMAGPEAAHYGGTLLTFPEPGPAGVVKTIRVVDGQQRLTTVSILLACIAEALGPDGQCGDWTAQIIREDRLTNRGKAPEKHRKLRLQHGDDDEYRLGLEGKTVGAGAVSQAWRIARRLVARNDVTQLFEGLKRLRVVSIGLEQKEDPQQIFESLNATGRPLTESEKVKNWLLMGLPDAEQQDLHDNHWLRIERTLGAEHTTEPTDIFLRDVLRWRTREIQGIDRVYEGLRRWAVREGQAGDRPALCRALARLAGLYGTITGTAKRHRNRKVERELRHLRALGIDVHRPLTLRLLHDASENSGAGEVDDALAKVLAGIGTWTTRMWLAERPMAGMNKAAAELAHGRGPGAGEDYVEYWLGRIQRLRNTRVGVPRDEEVQEGIRTRKAYGGGATRSAFAVLCELMEAEHGEESPARDRLTIEHVIPQKLTDEWKQVLGDDAEEIHGRHRDRLTNLTLSGDVTNAVMGTGTFNAKREVYRKSSIGITRSLADETEWNERRLNDERKSWLAEPSTAGPGPSSRRPRARPRALQPGFVGGSKAVLGKSRERRKSDGAERRGGAPEPGPGERPKTLRGGNKVERASRQPISTQHCSRCEHHARSTRARRVCSLPLRTGLRHERRAVPEDGRALRRRRRSRVRREHPDPGVLEAIQGARRWHSGTEGLLAGSVAVDESLERGGRQGRGLRRQSGADLALHSGGRAPGVRTEDGSDATVLVDDPRPDGRPAARREPREEQR